MEELAGALTGRDADAVAAVVAADADVVIDSGGHLPTAATDAQDGRAPAASALLALMLPATSVHPASINGVPGLILRRDDVVSAALTAEMRSGMLCAVWVVSNPDKLRHWNRH